MRRPSLVLAPLLALFFLAGCGPLTFTTELQGEGVVSGSPLGGVLAALPTLSSFTSIDFNQNQDFQNNNATRDMVESARVTLLTLKIVSPSDQDFAFLDQVQFVARAGDTEAVFAQKDGVAALKLPAPNPELQLDLLPVDLAPFVRSPTMSIVLRGQGRPPPRDTRIQATVRLQVAVKLP